MSPGIASYTLGGKLRLMPDLLYPGKFFTGVSELSLGGDHLAKNQYIESNIRENIIIYVVVGIFSLLGNMTVLSEHF